MREIIEAESGGLRVRVTVETLTTETHARASDRWMVWQWVLAELRRSARRLAIALASEDNGGEATER